MKKTNRLLELDALRGIAILGVVLFHFSIFSKNSFLDKNYFKYGCTGVDLFFMISGFVIFMSLERSSTVKEFWQHRAARLLPTYWLSILLALSFNLFWRNPITTDTSYILGNLTMLQPIFRSGYLLDPYWTLYVELTFYMTISIIWRLNLAKKMEQIIIVGILLSFIINGIYLTAENSSFVRFFIVCRSLFPLLSYIGFFGSGVIYYQIYKDGWTTKRALIICACFILTALIHNISGRFNLFFGTIERLTCVLIFNVLFILVANRRASFLKSKWLIFLGVISYPWYLFHTLFEIDIKEQFLLKYSHEFWVGVMLALSIIIAVLVTFYFEKPIQHWLKAKIKVNVADKEPITRFAKEP